VSSGAEQDDLERMLAASRELRSRYRAAAQEEPSAQVDDAIRARARRAVGARPRSAGSPFGSSWRMPLSIAAVLVLSVTLTVMVTRQDQHLPSADQSSARKAAPERAPAPAMTPAEPQPQAAKPAANAKEDAAGSREKARATRAPEQQRADEKDLYQAPAQPPLLDESAARELKKQVEPFPAAPPAPAPRAEPAPSPAPAPKSAAPAAAAVPEQERDAAATGGAADALRERGFAEKRQDTAQKPSSSNAFPTEGKLKAEEKLKSEELAGGLSAARIAPQRRQAPAAAAEQPQVATAPAPWESDPQAWLRHIERLVREQHMTEARDSFKAFRQHYPTYPLPAEFPLREP
jgi:hypothetical protein